MPRRERPAQTTRSEHWLREAVNSHPAVLDSMISDAFGWAEDMRIDWLSPVADDDYAEYYDQDFLDRLDTNLADGPKILGWSLPVDCQPLIILLNHPPPDNQFKTPSPKEKVPTCAQTFS